MSSASSRVAASRQSRPRFVAEGRLPKTSWRRLLPRIHVGTTTLDVVSHSICALVIVGRCDRDIAAKLDLRVVASFDDVSVMPIDHYYSTFWAADMAIGGELDVPMHVRATFPRDRVLLQIARDVTGRKEPAFAIIQTEYDNTKNHHTGAQWAAAFQGERRVSGERATINDALRAVGVKRRYPKDEFDTIGLAAFWSNPRHLDRFRMWCLERDAHASVQAVVAESRSEPIRATRLPPPA
jgi:hypothetical protein